MGKIITPRLLKGFRDLLPPQQQIRQELLGLLKSVLVQYGFVPIDTPLLEYSEILLGKGGGETERQIYRFSDQGGRDVALRFDLTIPLARYVAQHVSELQLPLRCYHIGKVFRGENTQRGRYREFMQFDFDIVGSEDAVADFEILRLIVDLFAAIDLSVVIHISHRELIPIFLAQCSPNQVLLNRIVDLRIIIDKLPKIGLPQVKAQLNELLPSDERRHIDPLLEFITLGMHLPSSEALHYLNTTLSNNHQKWSALAAYFECIFHWAKTTSSLEQLVLSPHITRGLDYYTGLLFETFVTQQSDIGAICSGGRYDNLASLYSNQQFAGVGGSIGIDRLLTLPSTVLQLSPTTLPDLLIIMRDQRWRERSITLSHNLRQQNIRCELYPQVTKLNIQLQYAEQKGIDHSLNWHASSYMELRNHQLRTSRYCSSVESIVDLLHLYRALPTHYRLIYEYPPETLSRDMPPLPSKAMLSLSRWQRLLQDISECQRAINSSHENL